MGHTKRKILTSDTTHTIVPSSQIAEIDSNKENVAVPFSTEVRKEKPALSEQQLQNLAVSKTKSKMAAQGDKNVTKIMVASSGGKITTHTPTGIEKTLVRAVAFKNPKGCANAAVKLPLVKVTHS